MDSNDKWAFLDHALAKRQQEQRLRTLKPLEPDGSVQVVKQGRTLINFSSNDYLGLSKHPCLLEAVAAYSHQYGAGATASRLVTGTLTIHEQLERSLAQACGRPTTLLFSSGFQANSTILPTLLDRHSLVLCDRLIHNSLLQGIFSSRARWVRYAHNDLNALTEALQQAKQQSYSRIVIVTETVFSMDGDRSDVAALSQLAQQHRAILYLDDAHALGVLGPDGMGLAAHQPGVDLTLATFGKALGAFGAFIACDLKVQDYLVNCCPGLIYTTALPPSVVGAIAAALSLMPSLEGDRQALLAKADDLRDRLRALGYDTGASSCQIIPLIMGDEAKTLRLSQWLEEQGIWATAIRPPTVPQGTARLRLALSSQHSDEQLNYLVDCLTRWRG